MLPVSNSWQADSALSARTSLNLEVTGHAVPPKCCTAAFAMDATEVAVALACHKELWRVRRSASQTILTNGYHSVNGPLHLRLLRANFPTALQQNSGEMLSTYPTTSQDSTQWTEAQSCLFYLEPKYSVALQIEVQQYKRQDTTWQHGGVYSAMYMYTFN